MPRPLNVAALDPGSQALFEILLDDPDPADVLGPAWSTMSDADRVGYGVAGGCSTSELDRIWGGR